MRGTERDEVVNMAHTNTARRRDNEVARERAARLRAQQQRRERRRRLAIIGGTVAALLAVVAVIVIVGVTSKHTSSKGGLPDRTAVPANVLAGVTGVPAATLDAIGRGSVATVPKAVNDGALTTDGKPKVFYVGAEFCPFCAGSRWALVQALSRFGTFNGLSLTWSSSKDVFPETPSFSFHGASYTSDVITFAGSELETRTGAPLDTLPATEAGIWHRYTGPQGSFPFLDVAGHFVEAGQSVNPATLRGLTASEIASRLSDPTDPVAQEVDGSANLLTAAICHATGNLPAAVCSANGVVAAGKALGG